MHKSGIKGESPVLAPVEQQTHTHRSLAGERQERLGHHLGPPENAGPKGYSGQMEQSTLDTEGMPWLCSSALTEVLP